MRFYFIHLFILFCSVNIALGQTITGTVRDTQGVPLVGVSVAVKGKNTGTATDARGVFRLEADFGGGSIVLVFSSIGYRTQEYTLTTPHTVDIQLQENLTDLGESVVIAASRVEENIMETPITVAKLSTQDLERQPSVDLFAAMNRLPGVDVSQSSLLVGSLSTRGFNSTKSERVIQLVDFADVMMPTSSVYAGNLMGASTLDLESVEVIYGANSALYGANAFNGVILQNTKDAFRHQGLSLGLRSGNRSLFDMQMRYAVRLHPRWAIKINANYTEADDFVGNNEQAIKRSTSGGLAGADPSNNATGSPLGWNAVNRYGDVGLTLGNTTGSNPYNFLLPLNDGQPLRVYMPGYAEQEIVWVNSARDNFKLFANDQYKAGNWRINPSLHFRLSRDIQASYEYKLARGNGIYQASSRYAWRGLYAEMHKWELKASRWWVRAYTMFDTGKDNYDFGFTGSTIQNTPMYGGEYRAGERYPSYLNNYMLGWARMFEAARTGGLAQGSPITGVFAPNPLGEQPVQFVLPVSIPANLNIAQAQALASQMAAAYLQLPANSPEWTRLRKLIAEGTGNLDLNGALTPLRPYNSAPTAAATPLTLKGAAFLNASRFWDYSAQYRLPVAWADELLVGASYRQYRLASEGTLFTDGINSPIGEAPRNAIRNWEMGAYTYLQKSVWDKRLKLSAAGRVDNFKNFGAKFSPRLSAVASLGAKRQHHLRTNVAVAYRQPAQLDQYIYLDLGTLLLLGNIGNGYEGIVPNSITAQNPNGTAIRLNKLSSEQMFTWEIGYKGNPLPNLYVEVSYYRSQYNNFIGTQRFLGREDGQAPQFVAGNPNSGDFVKPTNDRTRARLLQTWVNADAPVVTQGVVMSVEYFANKALKLHTNYTWAHISDAPGLILGFNTPTHKGNFGIGGELVRYLNYDANLRWNTAYLYFMPFDEGEIPAFYTLDAQASYHLTSWNTKFRVGGTNLTNTQAIQAWGSAAMGRVWYLGLVWEMSK